MEYPGGLDSAIIKHSEVPNASPELLHKNPNIRLLACNGARAWQALQRHISAQIPERIKPTQILRLPSSSPAHARISAQQKLQICSQALRPHLKNTPPAPAV